MNKKLRIFLIILSLLLSSPTFANLELVKGRDLAIVAEPDYGYVFIVAVTKSNKQLIKVDKFLQYDKDNFGSDNLYSVLEKYEYGHKEYYDLLKSANIKDCAGPLCYSDKRGAVYLTRSLENWIHYYKDSDKNKYLNRLEELKKKNLPVNCEGLEVTCLIRFATDKNLTKIYPRILISSSSRENFTGKCYAQNGRLISTNESFPNLNPNDLCQTYFVKNINNTKVNYWSSDKFQVLVQLDTIKYLEEVNSMKDELLAEVNAYESKYVEEIKLAKERIKLAEEQRKFEEEEKIKRIAIVEQEQKDRELFIKEQQPIERKLVGEFRKSIAVGTRTNCGLVIETKKNIIKVYIPVKDYGNEHWIEVNKIFPEDYQCNFYNGSYVEPNYKY